MRKLIAYAVLSAMMLAGAGGAFAYHYTKKEPATFDAAVLITVGKGMGTGFAIENGIVVTAAHVVGEAKTVSLKTPDGKIGAAEVLWTNKARDVALLRTDMKLPAAKLDCGTAHVGDDIFTVGNPTGVEFITAFGKIAGKARAYGTVKTVYVTNIATVYGQSGGAVYNSSGEVIGLNSMVMLAGIPTPGRPTPTMTGYGFVVPSSEICALMGRAE